jgi:hypothetical protein
LQRHSTIGEYNRSSRARRLAAFDALAPEQERNGQDNECDATKNASDDCRRLILAIMTAVLG